MIEFLLGMLVGELIMFLIMCIIKGGGDEWI